ncbi:MAG: aliphatic sulfonate transporter substrate-binding protein [Clostridiales bacterium]|jgi:taurine transport system substrate-binding protein|nr:aliphatic sulfonate transporter substrate-binding protein [Clostridiales bacterium]
MIKIFKTITIMMLIGVYMFTFTACGSKSNKPVVSDKSASGLPQVINFGILRVPNDETIAKAEGIFDKYFKEKGIKCNFIVFDSGVDANKALASGSIDFATMGNINAVIALAKGLDVQMIWIHEVLGEIEALAAKNNSGINKIEDLAGRKIATPFASTAHYSLLNAVKDAGLEKKVTLLDMRTPEIVAAWERGDIEAAYTWQPSLSNLLKNGKMLISSKDMAQKGYVTANVELVRKKFAEQYPELVAGFIACLSEAGDKYRENPKNAAAIEAKELEITHDDALAQMKGAQWLKPEELLGKDYFGVSGAPGSFAAIMKDTGDFLKAQGSIDKAPSQKEFNDYVTPAYIEKAVKLLENRNK